VGNEKISVDLINCEEGRSEILDFQVGKREERRVSESLMNSVVSSYQKGVLIEEDHRCILIIGGINIFLPYSPTEASACNADEEVMPQESKEEVVGPIFFEDNSLCTIDEVEEGNPTMTFIKEENERTLKFSQ
jgi:hypothetical protein